MEKWNKVSDSMEEKRPGFLDLAMGPVTIPMTNDYLFHALLQDDNEALRGLICALLKLDSDQVKSVVVTNPIELGAYIRVKDFILDVKVLLDDSAIINLELQVINRHNWPERSLSYLCRAFDSLNPGESYEKVKTAIHIGLLDFTLFPGLPEFYATYQMLNVKTYAKYSDKLSLSVVDLTHIDLATEEDRLYGIDCWAALFKATTWEEVKMIAERDENVAKAANTIWKLSNEDKIRLQCEAREDFYRNQRDMQEYMDAQADIIAQRENLIAQRENLIAQQENLIAQQEDKLAQQEDKLAQQEDKLAQQEDKLAQQEGKLAQQKGKLAQQAELLSEKDSVIEALKAELEHLKGTTGTSATE